MTFFLLIYLINLNSELISYNVDVLVSTISSPTTSNSTLAIYMEGRFGNTLFEIASGIAIAEHYKVTISKLEEITLLKLKFLIGIEEIELAAPKMQ